MRKIIKRVLILSVTIMKSEDKTSLKFKFNKRFWISLALSYLLSTRAILLILKLGYIDSTILGYGLTGIVLTGLTGIVLTGLTGIVDGLIILIVIVRLLNRADMVLRKRIDYVVLGIGLGFAVGFFGVTLLFANQIIAAIGSLGFLVLAIIVLPLAGGLIGYLAGKSFISPTPLITAPERQPRQLRHTRLCD